MNNEDIQKSLADCQQAMGFGFHQIDRRFIDMNRKMNNGFTEMKIEFARMELEKAKNQTRVAWMIIGAILVLAGVFSVATIAMFSA